MSEKGQYTSGPWKWFDYPDGRKLLAAPARAVIHCPDAPMGIEPSDAALIAAAPELLDSAKTLLKFCSRRDGSLASYQDWMQCFIEDGSTITECVEKAASAITKAEGR